MKRLFLILAMLAAFLLSAGCSSVSLKPNEYCGPDAQVSIIDSWQTSKMTVVRGPLHSETIMRGITLVIVNPTPRYVEVEASCHFKDGTLFGHLETGIDARSKRTILIRGFNQCMPGVCDKETVYCNLERK